MEQNFIIECNDKTSDDSKLKIKQTNKQKKVGLD